MPKKSKIVEYEIAMSDDEESIKVKLPEKKAPRKKIERSEEAKKAMLDRLAAGRTKAFEVRMQNKANREKVKAEEQEKTEKVSTYLKHEDIFEKKYSSKFEKLEEILSGIDNNFREIKEYKKEKRERQAKKEEKEKPEPVSAQVTQSVYPLPTDLIIKGQTPTASGIVSQSQGQAKQIEIPITSGTFGLPNYSSMTFGRRKY
jgi:hypothetical protein